jgi:hypothetical protein
MGRFLGKAKDRSWPENASHLNATGVRKGAVAD